MNWSFHVWRTLVRAGTIIIICEICVFVENYQKIMGLETSVKRKRCLNLLNFYSLMDKKMDVCHRIMKWNDSLEDTSTNFCPKTKVLFAWCFCWMPDASLTLNILSFHNCAWLYDSETNFQIHFFLSFLFLQVSCQIENYKTVQFHSNYFVSPYDIFLHRRIIFSEFLVKKTRQLWFYWWCPRHYCKQWLKRILCAALLHFQTCSFFFN